MGEKATKLLVRGAGTFNVYGMTSLSRRDFSKLSMAAVSAAAFGVFPSAFGADRGQGVSFDLPDIELRDIGARQNGLTASQVAAVVADALISRIAQRMLTNIDLLRKGGVEGAIDALKGLIR